MLHLAISAEQVNKASQQDVSDRLKRVKRIRGATGEGANIRTRAWKSGEVNKIHGGVSQKLRVGQKPSAW